MLRLNINGEDRKIDAIDPKTPLLWVLRDTLGMVGTKFGCGIAQCGACTVHYNGQPVRSCQLKVGDVKDGRITTIEGLAKPNGQLHALQQAWINHDVPQCGYCQAGQLMSAAALLERNSNPTDGDIDTALSGNLCRCGTYTRIVAAIHSAANELSGSGSTS